jgi:hypothetical protein
MDARERYLSALMSHVEADEYPSASQMQHIEGLLKPDEVDGYVELLVDKLEASEYPSVPLMRRIERLLAGR